MEIEFAGEGVLKGKTFCPNLSYTAPEALLAPPLIGFSNDIFSLAMLVLSQFQDQRLFNAPTTHISNSYSKHSESYD